MTDLDQQTNEDIPGLMDMEENHYYSLPTELLNIRLARPSYHPAIPPLEGVGMQLVMLRPMSGFHLTGT